MKRWLIPLMLGFGITMALIIGRRMSTDAMAVVIGVAVGVAASVPTSVLIVAMLRRERRTWHQEPLPQPPVYQPLPPQQPIIMLNPADLFQRNAQQQYTPLPPPQSSMEDGGLRRLRVVGDDDDWMD